ncbi:MAG TPA: hypothetical protein VFT65_00485 [Candidatus Angelobacter sp.]|nr:hypothetical protein [Candidatus Angelobacter sp.]
MAPRFWLALLLFSGINATAQECSTTVLVSFYDQLTTNEIQTLKMDDIDVRIDKTPLPLLSFSRDFNNRLLILVETDGAARSEKIDDVVTAVTQQARQAPEGKPVAFGIYAEHSEFTEGFIADPEKRAPAVGAVMEKAGAMGARVALWDALHQALARFGPHQPGDTILLIGEPYDNASRESASDLEKEFIARGTRLFVMRRIHGSRVDRDFGWRSHELEKAKLDRLTLETGGLLSEYVPSLIRFAWAGYMLEIKEPPGMNRPRKWRVRFRGPAAETHRKTNFHYPALLPPCSTTQASR